MKPRARTVVVLGLAAALLGAVSWFAYQRLVVGRANAAACGDAAFGKRNVPEQGFAVVDESGWGMHKKIVFHEDGRIVDGLLTYYVPAGETSRTRSELEATGIYALGSGCYVPFRAVVPTDEGSTHLWLVRDGVGHEFAWRGAYEKPDALEQSERILRTLRSKASPKSPEEAR